MYLWRTQKSKAVEFAQWTTFQITDHQVGYYSGRFIWLDENKQLRIQELKQNTSVLMSASKTLTAFSVVQQMLKPLPGEHLLTYHASYCSMYLLASHNHFVSCVCFQMDLYLLLWLFHLRFPKLFLKGMTHFSRYTGNPAVLTMGQCFIVSCLRNCGKMWNSFKMYTTPF